MLKQLALAFTLATTAHAGGICTDKWTGSDVVTGTVNSPQTAWSQNIAGGTIALHDAIRVRVSGEAAGAWGSTGIAMLQLNGQDATMLCLRGGEIGYVETTITRTGTTTGRAESALVLDYLAPIPMGHADMTGLNWGSAQTLAVEAYNEPFVTLTLEAICVER